MKGVLVGVLAHVSSCMDVYEGCARQASPCTRQDLPQLFSILLASSEPSKCGVLLDI